MTRKRYFFFVSLEEEDGVTLVEGVVGGGVGVGVGVCGVVDDGVDDGVVDGVGIGEGVTIEVGVGLGEGDSIFGAMHVDDAGGHVVALHCSISFSHEYCQPNAEK